MRALGKFVWSRSFHADDHSTKNLVALDEMMPEGSAHMNDRDGEQQPCENSMDWGEGRAVHIHRDNATNRQRLPNALRSFVHGCALNLESGWRRGSA